MNPSSHRTWIVAKVVMLRPDGKVLALRRSHSAPHYALTWDLPGGLIEYGEDPVEGLKRETREETGIEITEPMPVMVTSNRPDGHYEISIYFKANVESDNVMLSYEHDRMKWVSPTEFTKLEAPTGYARAVERVAEMDKT